jgi:hypothetical protein
MLDEMQVVRHAFDAPVDDPQARESARGRLRLAFQAERKLASTPPLAPSRRSVYRGVKWIAVAALLLVVAMFAKAILPVRSASQELRGLASVASRAPSMPIESGTYLYSAVQTSPSTSTTVLTAGNQDVITGVEIKLWIRKDVETWLASDGSGTRVTTVTEASFQTDADRAAWLKAGKPDVPIVGEKKTESFGPHGLTSYDPSRLPTEAGPLLDALRVPPDGSGQLDDQQVMARVVQLLASADPSPALRSALFEVLADFSGIRDLGTVTDPLGRSGTGLVFPTANGSRELIFDGSTSAVLATIDLTSSGDQTAWEAFTGSKIVDRVGAR